mgnify:CR=1 FL=1
MDTSNFKEVFESPKVKELTAQVAALEDKFYRSLVERRQKDRWGTRINCDGHKLEFPTQFTPTTLNELIEKVEKMTIERCALEANKSWFKDPCYIYTITNDIRNLPTGQIKLEDLL